MNEMSAAHMEPAEAQPKKPRKGWWVAGGVAVAFLAGYVRSRSVRQMQATATQSASLRLWVTRYTCSRHADSRDTQVGALYALDVWTSLAGRR